MTGQTVEIAQETVRIKNVPLKRSRYSKQMKRESNLRQQLK